MSCDLVPLKSTQCLLGNLLRVVVEHCAPTKVAPDTDVGVALREVREFVLRVEHRARPTRTVLQNRGALHANRGVAVSYTHLDVYKRQVPARADKLLALQHAAYAIEAELIGDDRIPPLHEDEAGLIAAGLSWLLELCLLYTSRCV